MRKRPNLKQGNKITVLILEGKKSFYYFLCTECVYPVDYIVIYLYGIFI